MVVALPTWGGGGPLWDAEAQTRQMFVMTNTVILSQQKFCLDKHTFVVTNTCLSWQNTFFHDKNMLWQRFVATSIFLSRQKTCFVVTKRLSREKWYWWQLLTVITDGEYCWRKLEGQTGLSGKGWRWWDRGMQILEMRASASSQRGCPSVGVTCTVRSAVLDCLSVTTERLSKIPARQGGKY